MQIQLESTDKIVTLITDAGEIPARVWEGHTAGGVPIHAYITRVAVRDDRDSSELERELIEHRRPSAEVQAIPLRLIV